MSLPEPQKTAIRSKLLECLGSEGVNNVRNKIGDAVAEIARQYTSEGMRYIKSWLYGMLLTLVRRSTLGRTIGSIVSCKSGCKPRSEGDCFPDFRDDTRHH